MSDRHDMMDRIVTLTAERDEARAAHDKQLAAAYDGCKNEIARARTQALKEAEEIAREHENDWHKLNGNPVKRIADAIAALASKSDEPVEDDAAEDDEPEGPTPAMLEGYRLLREYRNRREAATPPAPPDPRNAAERSVCSEIVEIMRVYREQEASSYGVDTPGGLEHMGDVWRLLSGWDEEIRAALSAPQPRDAEEDSK